MSGLRRHLAALVLAAVLLPGPGRAEDLVLTPEGMVQAALLLIDRGNPEQALKFAKALLLRDPKDKTALILKSRAERDLGEFRAAVLSGRQAWRLSVTDPERHAAALVVAQGLASGDRRLAAQFWLRRAVEYAPDAQARSEAARDLRYVRARSRLALRLDLDVRPSSNVNGGSSARILEFQGIPMILSPDARALAGWRGQIGLTGSYGLAESPTAKTDLRFGLVQRRVVLSGAAQAAAPMARAADYAFAALEVGVDQAWKLNMPGGEATVAATFGQNRYGGVDMSRYGRLELGVSRALGSATAGRLALSAERQMRLDNASRSATVLGLSVGVAQKLGNGDRLNLTMELRRSQSEATDIDHRAKSLTLGWTKAEAVLGTGVSASLGVTDADYDLSRFTSNGRHDLTVEAQLDLAFERMDYMGFIPVMSIEAENTRSNVALNQSQSVGVGFSIRSSF